MSEENSNAGHINSTPEEQIGALVLASGEVWLVLGRSVTGAWLLLPPPAWGTEVARLSVHRTFDRPVPLPVTKCRSTRTTRDRRGQWARRS